MRKAPWLAAIVALILGIGGPLLGQPPANSHYEPFTPTQEFMDAWHLAELGQRPEAVQAFQRIAEAHPGTSLGARSLFKAAYFTPEDDQAAAIYRSIVAQYPNSRFALQANLLIISDQYAYSQTQQFVEAVDQLAQSFGAPSLRDISRGNSRLTAQVHSLPTEIQQGLIPVYSEMHGGLSLWLRRYDEALALATFCRETFSFDRDANSFFLGAIEHDLMLKRFGNITSYDFVRTDPVVRIKSPKPGQAKGPRPRIRIKMFTGDYKHAQVDVAKIQLALDGQDIKPHARIRSKINTSMKIDKTFERLLLTVRPLAPLTKGPHTLSITVPTQGYQGGGPGITVANVTFNVGKNRDDNDDESTDDDDWNWGGWRDGDDDD